MLSTVSKSSFVKALCSLNDITREYITTNDIRKISISNDNIDSPTRRSNIVCDVNVEFGDNFWRSKDHNPINRDMPVADNNFNGPLDLFQSFERSI